MPLKSGNAQCVIWVGGAGKNTMVRVTLINGSSVYFDVKIYTSLSKPKEYEKG